jgi:CRISPR-associated protein Csx17
MITLSLQGCAAEPLGSYLKGLGVLRLLSQQADAEARGWWGAEGFQLESTLSEQEVASFFLTKYQPTPILSPWNAGSGFASEKGRAVIDTLATSTLDRLRNYREAIAIAREIVNDAHAAEPGEQERRARVLRDCRNRLPDDCVDWLDAAITISADGTRVTAPILGTGGNEGNLEYSNHFMNYVALLLLDSGSGLPIEDLLRNALFNDAAQGFQPSSVGQFDPGRAGGKNQGPKMMTEKVPSNPWNFVLTLEGAVAWAAGLYRRQGVSYRSFMCSPFTVRSTPVGYGSATDSDNGSSRAEIWTPLWSQPARYAEIRCLLREGRASLETRPAQTGLEFAEAACSLGVDRGISAFVRYSLLERRGKGYYIALPTGRFPVTRRAEADLVRELMSLLERADTAMRDAPASFRSLRRQVDEAVYESLLRGSPNALLDVATSFGRLQRWILSSDRPIRLPATLSAGWVESLKIFPEARMAAGLAGIWDSTAGNFQENLDVRSRRFAWTGRTICQRMIRVLERRLLDAADASHNPVRSNWLVSLSDLSRFIESSVDETVLEDLAFAFSALRERKLRPMLPSDASIEIWPIYALLKHLFLPDPLSAPSGAVLVRSDARVLSLLSAGDGAAAAEIAVRRLRIAGFAPIEVPYGGGIDGERLAAALLIPVPYGPALRNPVMFT